MSRTKGRLVLALAASCALASAGGTGFAAETRRSGDWSITVEKDRFEDRTNIYAVVMRGPSGFALRCLFGELSLALIEAGPEPVFHTGDRLAVRLRADRGDVIPLFGSAISDRVAEFATDRADIDGLRSAREIALRVETKVLRYDIVFPARGTIGAVKSVLSACPEPASNSAGK